jgi:5-methylcytosine-specific restriction protein A
MCGAGRTEPLYGRCGRLGDVFELGKVYRRKDLHERFGGQEQQGIVTPKGQPFIFLVTGEAGLAYGYKDETREDGSFLYYGEGKHGPMEFVRGNRAVRDHAKDGRDLHLFDFVPPAHLRYLGQYVCSGYQLVDDVPDEDDEPRTAIAFELAPIDEDQPDQDRALADVSGLSLDELRQAALDPPAAGTDPPTAKRNAYYRSAAVRTYTLARADGSCEGCRRPAPFTTRAGRPYLEPHHTRRISDGGPDHPASVIALCPTCHRRAHYADDGEAFNESLITWLRQNEGPI